MVTLPGSAGIAGVGVGVGRGPLVIGAGKSLVYPEVFRAGKCEFAGGLKVLWYGLGVGLTFT